MKNAPSSPWIKLASLVPAWAAIASCAFAFDVINEDFNYANWDAMHAASPNWSRIVYSPSASPSFYSLGESNYAIGLSNRGIQQNFGKAITLTENFDLTARVAMNNYQRSFYILITSAPDTEGKISGYGILWNTSLITNNNAQGAVSLQKISSVSESSLGVQTTGGTNFGSSVVSGFAILNNDPAGASSGALNPSSSNQFSTIRLTWSSDGALNLYLGSNSVAAISIQDTSFSSFSNIYISGNSSAFLDQLTLTTTASPVPEPGTWTLIVGAGMLLLATGIRARQKQR